MSLLSNVMTYGEKYNVVASERLSAEDIADIKSAVVIENTLKYEGNNNGNVRNQMLITHNNGGLQYITLSRNCSLGLGESVDKENMHKLFILKFHRSSDNHTAWGIEYEGDSEYSKE